MITIWDEIFKQLWITGHHGSMQLAAALLSDKEELNNWWYSDKAESNDLHTSHLQKYATRPRWGQLHDVLEIRAKHWKSAHIYLKQAYENWKNNSVE